MTRYDITPKVDETDGGYWGCDDHYTGPRPIPKVSPLVVPVKMASTFKDVLRVMGLVLAFIAGVVVGLILIRGRSDGATEAKRKDATIGHVRQFLLDRGAPDHRAGDVASAIVSAAKTHNVDPALLTAIITVENPQLRSQAQSNAGAVGLMQVMPFWGRDRQARATCGGSDLTNDRINLCYGIHVLKFTIRSRQTLPGALLFYNGCRSFQAPCGRYAQRVLDRRSQLAANFMRESEAD